MFRFCYRRVRAVIAVFTLFTKPVLKHGSWHRLGHNVLFLRKSNALLLYKNIVLALNKNKILFLNQNSVLLLDKATVLVLNKSNVLLLNKNDVLCLLIGAQIILTTQIHGEGPVVLTCQDDGGLPG